MKRIKSFLPIMLSSSKHFMYKQNKEILKFGIIEFFCGYPPKDLFIIRYIFLNAPLGISRLAGLLRFIQSLFGIAPKSNQKTLVRCKPNRRSFHYENIIYL